jgi:AcrR family transcriptional regulator
MGMSIPYEKTGRTKQKARTRTFLVEAARELLREGVSPTVEQAADRAGISRTTAYRYFTNQRALLAATYPEIEESSLLGDDPPADAGRRLDLALERLGRQLLDHEHELRAQLRLSLEVRPTASDQLPLRQGRAIGWFEDALAPLRPSLGDDDLHRLALAIRATFGIESLVWLVDVAGLGRPEAVALMRASARALFDQANSRAGTAVRNGAPAD